MPRLSFFLTFYILLTFLSVSGFSKEVPIQDSSCESSKDTSVAHFSSQEMNKIVHTTGMDPRSVCSFISLGSHTYSLDILKQTLLSDKGTMKSFLNQHYLFPEDGKFFQSLSYLLFSKDINDTQQVLNALVLNDLLYGYTIGQTIPFYMELFLFYSTSNSGESQEEAAIDKILPYISYIQEHLLAKKNFTVKNLQAYTNQVRNLAKTKETSRNGNSPKSGSPSVTQDSPY